MLAPALIATIRSIVPLAIGLLVVVAKSVGIDLPAGLLTEGVGLAAATGYWALVTFLERKVNPAFGWLLGYAAVPDYAKPNGPEPENTIAADSDTI